MPSGYEKDINGGIMKDFIKGFDENKLKEAFEIKRAYSAGEISLDFANAQMKAHIGTMKAAELAYIEQYMQDAVDDECIKENLEEILAIYQDVLESPKFNLPPGHPIQNYIDENKKIRELLLKMESGLQKSYIKNEWDEWVEDLNRFKIHLSRKQNQLYSLLEKKGFDRPSTTMWLYDNAVRDKISALSEKMSDEFKYEEIKKEFEEFKGYILDLMNKEETILYPTSLEMISQDEFLDMMEGDREIGYCLIEPSDEFVKNTKRASVPQQSKEEGEKSGAKHTDFANELEALISKYNVGTWNEDTPMNVKQGILSLNQINLLFQHLPVDISYVDEKELVAFYSDTKHRVFPRSKGVIGRDVKNCHPKNSVYVVEEIIEKFRSGEQDRVDFWINKPNLFIYILYVAVRDEQGNFRGVMEMMQDCTKIRSLEGSRTLLNWENDEMKGKSDNKSQSETKSQPETKAEVNSESETKPESETQSKSSSDNKILKLENHTKLADVFKQYPDFKDYMVNASDKFKMLNSPMFKIVGAVATVEMASERSGMSIEEIKKIFEEFLKTK